jgi:hypothetical protein
MRREGPIAAVVRGALAGAAGTAAMDAFWYARRRAGGGEETDGEVAAGLHPASQPASARPPAEDDGWDDSTDVLEDWPAATASARVGKQVYEGVTRKTLEARFARVTGALVHWSYGMWWGGLFGLVAATARRPRTGWGPFFGATVWGTSYVLLPITGLYRPLWEYRVAELAPDLAAHLIYGTGTAVAFRLLDADRD